MNCCSHREQNDPVNLQVSVLILKFGVAKTSAAFWTNCYYLWYACLVLMQLNLDIPQQRNEKSLITNTHGIFKCLLHTASMAVRNTHLAQRSLIMGVLFPLWDAFLLPCELTEVFLTTLLFCFLFPPLPTTAPKIILEKKFSFSSTHYVQICRPTHLSLNGV